MFDWKYYLTGTCLSFALMTISHAGLAGQTANTLLDIWSVEELKGKPGDERIVVVGVRRNAMEENIT